MLWNRQGWKERRKCPIRRSMLISAVQSAVCVQRSLVIDWKPWDKTRGYFLNMCGLNVSFPARLSVRRPGTTPGRAAPPGWASSIGGGEEAGRWESVSVSGDAPGLISLRRSGLGSMEARSLQRGEMFCLCCTGCAALTLRLQVFRCLFQSRQHAQPHTMEKSAIVSLCNHIQFTFSHSRWIIKSVKPSKRLK